MSCFICPVCRGKLNKNEKMYACENGHTFDISRHGYVNLLMASGKGKVHGDDKVMLRARADFLNRGFYDVLSREVSESAVSHCKNGGRIVDAGCGEGKYTADIKALSEKEEKDIEVVGIDISKDALSLAARRDKDISFAVASTASMPLEAESADVIVSIFAPFFAEEFSRVLKKDGIIIRVFPLEKHLWELKGLLYDNPYENPIADMAEEGLLKVEERGVSYNMEFKSNGDIESLFAMTPYFYRTGDEDKKKLSGVTRLSCRAEFGIVVYKKK